jgi:hypothetical protein
MVQILAPFLLLSAFSGTCLSLSHPVKRDVVTVEGDITAIGQAGLALGVALADYTGTDAQTKVGFEVSL